MDSLLYQNLVVVVIDMQPDFWKSGTPEVVRLIETHKNLLKWVASRPQKIPVLEVVTENFGKTDERVAEALGACSPRRRVVKYKQSLFRDKLEKLRPDRRMARFLPCNIGHRNTILLSGINSHQCIFDTWKDAINYGHVVATTDDLHANVTSGTDFDVGFQDSRVLAEKMFAVEPRKVEAAHKTVFKTAEELMSRVDAVNGIA